MLAICAASVAWISSPSSHITSTKWSRTLFENTISILFGPRDDFAISRDVTRHICYPKTSTVGSGPVQVGKSLFQKIFSSNFWFAGKSLSATNSTPTGWPVQPWSQTGYIGQFLGSHQPARPQPDNAEYLLHRSPPTQEACLSVNNNWFEDGISWHDTACYHKKPFICEDSDMLIRRARALTPSVRIE